MSPLPLLREEAARMLNKEVFRTEEEVRRSRSLHRSHSLRKMVALKPLVEASVLNPVRASQNVEKTKTVKEEEEILSTFYREADQEGSKKSGGIRNEDDG